MSVQITLKKVWGQSKHKERRKVKQFDTFNLKQKWIKSNKLIVSFTFIISETIKSTENQLVSQ